MSYFFEEETEQSVLHIKAAQRTSVDSQGVRIESIGSRIHAQEVEPFLVRLAPHTRSGERQVIHAGHEVVYCLKGKIEYLIDGTVYQVEAGDFLVFAADLPHLWRNPFDVSAEFILILQTPGATLEPVQIVESQIDRSVDQHVACRDVADRQRPLVRRTDLTGDATIDVDQRVVGERLDETPERLP